MSDRPLRFLFCMFQGGGNIPLIVPIISRLVSDGHAVRVLVGPGVRVSRLPVSARLQERIADAGATLRLLAEPSPHPLDSTSPARGLIHGWTPAAFKAESAGARVTLWSPPWALQAQDELARDPFDAVAADFHLPGALAAAEAHGIPSAALVHAVGWRPMSGIPPRRLGLMPARSVSGWIRDLVGNAIIERVHSRDGLPAHNLARKRLGLDPLRSWFQQYDRADRVLILTSRAFDFTARRLAPNVRYVGTPFDDAHLPPSAWTSPWPADDDRPLVLISLSTLAQGQGPVLHRILEAVGTLPVRVLVTLGPTLDRNQFSVTPNVVLETFVPHAAVLPHVSAMVTQCGLGTIMKALARGVPLVCIPLTADQPDNAARAVARGAGIRLTPDVTADEIKRGIGLVLEQKQFREGARRFAEQLLKQDGARRAAQELQALAGQQQGQMDGQPRATLIRQ